MAKLIKRTRKVPIRAIVGKPGRFWDSRTNKAYDISQAYEGDKYDSILVATGAQAAGTQYIYFQNLANKNRIDTNFRTQNRLDPNEKMVLERIGMYIHTATGNNVVLMNDARLVLENAFVRTTINDDILWEGPATWLPSGYGLYGATVENAQSVYSIGVPGTAAAAKLRRKQMLTSDHSLGGDMTYQARAWIGGGYVVPTVVNAVGVVVKLVFHGPISRPATH